MNLLCMPLFLVLTILFFFSVNPLSMGLILIAQTISLALFLASSSLSSWFLFMLALIFIGGMLILFVYVTSIFPNEKFTFNQLKTMILAVLMTLVIVSYLIYLFSLNLNFNFSSTLLTYSPQEDFIMHPTKKFFSSYTVFMLMFLVNYLFFCMIVVIHITNFFQGPLRKMS